MDDFDDLDMTGSKPSIFVQVAAEHALQQTGAKYSKLSGVIKTTRARRPDHPSLARADAKLAEFGDSLTGWLATWVPTNGFRADGTLAGH